MTDNRLTWGQYLDWAGDSAMPLGVWADLRAQFPDIRVAQMHDWWTKNPNTPTDQYQDPWQ